MGPHKVTDGTGAARRRRQVRTALAVLSVLLLSAVSMPADAQIKKFFQDLFGSDEPKPAPSKEVKTTESAKPAAAETAEPACPKIMQKRTAAKHWPEACGTGRPPEDLMPANGEFTGLWDIQAPNNGFMEEILVALTRGGHGVGYLSATGNLVPAGSMRRKGASHYGHFNPNVMAVESGRLKLHLATGGFAGRTKLWLEVRPSGSPDVLVGEWQYGEKKRIRGGPATMRRRPPARFSRITIGNARRGKDGSDRFAFGERPGRIERSHPVTCGAGRSRANCDRVWITIEGENLAGGHTVWIDPASHMEIRDAGWTCRNGKRRDYGAGWTRCGGTKRAGDGVVALSMRLYLWDGIAPGRRTLWVDGKPIPIEMVIHGYPKDKEKPKPDLVSLRALDGKGTVLDALDEDGPFVLEAVFKADHPDHWVKVTMPGGRRVTVDGPLGATRPGPTLTETPAGVREIVLRRTADATVFRSGPLKIVAENERDR